MRNLYQVLLLGILLLNQMRAQANDTILPAKLSADRVEVKLPATADRRAVGAGGRYLILTIPSLRQVAIFDVNEVKVVKYLPVDDGDIHVAAGAEKLLIVLGEKKLISRYSLKTFERELTTSLDIPTRIAGVCMGAASEGPLLIAKEGGNTYHQEDKGLMFVDIKQLKRIKVTYPRNNNMGTNEWNRNSHLDATLDGQTFLLKSREPVVLRFNDPEIQVVSDRRLGTSQNQVVRICPRGRFVYSPRGILTPELQTIGEPDSGNYQYVFRIPGVEGNYFLAITSSDRNRSSNPNSPTDISLHLAGEREQLVKIDGIKAYEGGKVRSHPAHSPSFERSFFFVSSANLLIQLPLSNDKLILHRVDVEKLLDAFEIDYLYVKSQPPSSAQPGQEFRYQLAVKSKAKGLQFKLLSAPEGMSLSKDGLVSWNVPDAFNYSEVHVIVEIVDGLKQQVLHSFRLATGGTKGPAPEGIVSIAAEGELTSSPDDFSRLPELKPSSIRERTKIALPAAFDDVKVGGGGRYLVLHFKSLKKIGVFDVSQAKMLGYISAPGNQVGFAAGANRLVVVSGDLGVISRYGLSSLKRELTRPISLTGALAHVFMGHSTAGPVYVSSSGQSRDGICVQYDLQSLNPSKFVTSGDRSRQFGTQARVKISGNGKTISVWEVGVSPSGLQTYLQEGNSWKGYYDHTSVGSIIPSADGRLIFTGGGIFTGQLARKIDSRGFMYSPATHGDFYLRSQINRSENIAGAITVHKMGDERPLVKLPDSPYADEQDSWGRAAFSMEQRVVLIPAARALVLTPRARDHLVLIPFDLQKLMDESGIDYLYVNSQASGDAKLGEEFTYNVDVKSKRGGVKYELASAPRGMAISNDGKLTWTVPDRFSEESATVILTIKDDSGQELFHTFSISIVGAAERIRAWQEAEEQRRIMDLQKQRIAEQQRKEELRIAALRREAEKQQLREKWLKLAEEAVAADEASKTQIIPPAKYPERAWTDKRGSTIRAQYVNVFGGSAILRMSGGSQLTVPLSNLSDDDQAYAESELSKLLAVQEKLAEWDKARVARQGDQASRRELEVKARANFKEIIQAVRRHQQMERFGIRSATFDVQSRIPLLSWRVHILPYLGEKELYEEFRLDEPWFSEHNKKLISRMPPIYRSPGSAGKDGKTQYLAVTGKQFPMGNPGDVSQANRYARFARANAQAAFVEVGDQLSVTWTRPDDIVVDDLDGHQVPYWFGMRDDGLLVGFLDGDVRKLKSSNDPQAVVDLFLSRTSPKNSGVDFFEQ